MPGSQWASPSTRHVRPSTPSGPFGTPNASPLHTPQVQRERPSQPSPAPFLPAEPYAAPSPAAFYTPPSTFPPSASTTPAAPLLQWPSQLPESHVGTGGNAPGGMLAGYGGGTGPAAAHHSPLSAMSRHVACVCERRERHFISQLDQVTKFVTSVKRRT